MEGNRFGPAYNADPGTGTSYSTPSSEVDGSINTECPYPPCRQLRADLISSQTNQRKRKQFVKEKKKHYIVFKDENNKFMKQAFNVNKKEGMASGEEEKATNKWIHSMEKSQSVDLNGDNVFGSPKSMSKKMSPAEHNNDIFENKLNLYPILRIHNLNFLVF